MSHFLYSTRLYWANGRGIAKLHGVHVQLTSFAFIGEIVEIDYTPEVCVARCRDRFGGWRDMVGDEIRAADALLHRVTAPTGC